MSIDFSCMFDGVIWSCLMSMASAPASSECVWFLMFPSRGQIPESTVPTLTRGTAELSATSHPSGALANGDDPMAFVRIIEFIYCYSMK